MSVFDGFAEAMASVPPAELKFSFREISVLLDALYHYLSWLQAEYDQVDHIYCTHDVPDDQTAEGLISKLLNYSFR